MPLQQNDPRQLGAFRLSGRTSEDAAGVVYLAHDADGRSVSVATLSEGAAADPAARDRFTAAVTKGRGVEGRPRVLGSNTSGSAVPWVAVAHADDTPGAEVFLRPVRVGEGAGGGRGTPSYLPYWSHQRAPAAGRWSWSGGGRSGAGAAPPDSNRAMILGLLVLLLFIVALLVLLYIWLSSLSQQADSGQPQPGQSASPSPSQQQSPSPSSSQRPSPSQGAEPSQDRDESPSPEGSPSSEVPSVPLDGDDPDTTGDPSGMP